MKRAAIAGALAGVIANLVAGNAPASASEPDERSCAIKGEYRQLAIGDRRELVESVLDGAGKPASVRRPANVIQREYRLCGRSWDKGRLIVNYGAKSGRLSMALWLTVRSGTLS